MEKKIKSQEEKEMLLRQYFEGKLNDAHLHDFLKFLQTQEGQELLAQHMGNGGFPSCDLSLPKEQSNKIYGQINGKLKRKQGNYKLVTRVAATLLLLVSLCAGVFYAAKKHNVSPDTMVHVAGTQQELELPDGTHVKLNTGSHLSYSAKMMDSEKREVVLEGEAFFEVAKNPEKPFFISAGKAKVKVLGTVFNVKMGRENVSVAVEEGRVLLGDKELENSVVLTANEVGVFDRNGAVKKAGQPAQNYFSWFEHYLDFENMPLGQVKEQLENIFDINIEFADPDLNNKYFTAYMRSASVDEVMAQLALSMELKLEKTDGKYTLKK